MRTYISSDLPISCYPNDPIYGVPVVDGCEVVPIFGDSLHPRYPTKFIYRDATTHAEITNADAITALMNKYRDLWLHGQRLRSTLEGLAYGAPGSGPGFVLNTDKHFPNIWNSAEVVASGAGEIVTISDATLGDNFAEVFANCFNLGNGNTGGPTPGDGFIVIGTGSLTGMAIVRDYRTVSVSSVDLLLTTYKFPQWEALHIITSSTEPAGLRLNFRVTVFPYNLMQPYTNYCVHCIDTCLNIFSSAKEILGGKMPVINVPNPDDTSGFGGSDFICGAFASNPTGMENFTLECNQTTCSHYSSHHTTGGTTISADEMAQLYYGIAGTFYTLFNYSGGWTMPKFDYNDHGLPGIYPQNGMHLQYQEDYGFGMGKYYDIWPILKPSTVDNMFRITYRDVDFYNDYNPIECQKKHPIDGTDWTTDGSTQRELGTADRAFDFPSVVGHEGLVLRVRDFERNTDDVTFPVATQIVIADPELKITITPNGSNLDFILEESRFAEKLATPLNRNKGAGLADISGVIGNYVTFWFKFGVVNIHYPGSGQDGVTVAYATGGNVVQPEYLQTIWNAESAELFGDEQAKLYPGDAIKITAAEQTIYGICTEATAFAVARELSGNCLDNSISQFVQPTTGVPSVRSNTTTGVYNKCDSAVVKFEPEAVELLAAATGPFNVEYYRAAVHLPGTPPAITICNLDDTVAYTVPPENLTSYFTQGKITFSVAVSEIEAGTKYIKVSGKRYFAKANTRVLESAAQYMLDLQKAISWWTYAVSSTIVPGGTVGGGGSQMHFTMAGSFINEPEFYPGTELYYTAPDGTDVWDHPGERIGTRYTNWFSYDSITPSSYGKYCPYNTWTWLQYLRVCENSNPTWPTSPVILKPGAVAGLSSYSGIYDPAIGMQRNQTMGFPAVPIAHSMPAYYYNGYQNQFDRVENATMTYSVSVPATYSQTVSSGREGLMYGKFVYDGNGVRIDEEPGAEAELPGMGFKSPGGGFEVWANRLSTVTNYPMPDWVVSIIMVTTIYRTKMSSYSGHSYETQEDPLIFCKKVQVLHSVAAGESWSETLAFDGGLIKATSNMVTYDAQTGISRGKDISFYVAADCPGLGISIETPELPTDIGSISFDGRVMFTLPDGLSHVCYGTATMIDISAGAPTLTAGWSGKYAGDIIPGSQIFAAPELGSKWPHFYGSGNHHELVPFFNSLPK